MPDCGISTKTFDAEVKIIKDCLMKLKCYFIEKDVKKLERLLQLISSTVYNLKVALVPQSEELEKANVSLEVKDINELCPFELKGELETQQHKVLESVSQPNVNFACNYCRKTYSRNQDLQTHVLIRHRVKSFSCNICRVNFIQEIALVNHVKRQHNSVKPESHVKLADHSSEITKLGCGVCGEYFFEKNLLLKHLQNHKSEKLKNHTDGTIMKVPDKTFDTSVLKCEKCDFSTKRKSHFLTHMKTHQEAKPYLCNLCDYKSSKNSHLEIHLRRHTGEKLFVCDTCSFKTVDLHSLNQHKTIHTGEKKFLCNFCDYKTKSSSILRVHICSHIDEKLFQCVVCGYKAADPSSLRNHVRIHSEEKPYECGLCNYRAAHQTELLCHLKTHQKRN